MSIDFGALLEPRHIRVLDLTLDGLSRIEIAKEMGLTKKTVHNYFGHMTIETGLRHCKLIIEYYLWKYNLQRPV